MKETISTKCSLSDTIQCPECKGSQESMGCWCFGRGYITIRMMNEWGIKEYVKNNTEEYLKLRRADP